MDKFIMLKQKYEEALQLQHKQLALNLQPEEDFILQQFKELEDQVQSTFVEIEALNVSVDEDLSTIERKELIMLVEGLMSNNILLKNKIDLLYKGTSATMNQVARHKKTLTGYGGAGQYDDTAYYFDEKR